MDIADGSAARDREWAIAGEIMDRSAPVSISSVVALLSMCKVTQSPPTRHSDMGLVAACRDEAPKGLELGGGEKREDWSSLSGTKCSIPINELGCAIIAAGLRTA